MSAKPGNKYALGNNGGRPAFFESPEDLRKKIIEYFDWIEGEVEEIEKEDEEGNTYTETNVIREPEPPTITGLALFLGFASRQSLYDYMGNKEEFSYSIKRALLIVEKEYEMRLGYKSPTGAIFALKNFGWKDNQDHNHNVKGDNVIFYLPDNGRGSTEQDADT